MPVPVFMVGDAPPWYYPLALGMLQARALSRDDLRQRLRFFPLLTLPVAPTAQVARGFGPGIWLFSSYAWSYARMLEISRAVKALDPRNVTVHGGPSIPRHEDAVRRLQGQEPHMDILVRGEGELVCEEVLRHLADAFDHRRDWREGLERIAGVTFGDVRTPDAPRIADLDELPSPYLEGLFDSMSGLLAVLETNRGCPYTCAFCDWGSLVGQKIKRFDLERVKAEIDWIARRGTTNLYLADGNFGIFERDVEIAEAVARAKERYGFPRKMTPTFAKNSTDRLVEIMSILRGAGIVVEANLGIQSTDPDTLAAVKRTNIRTERYRDLMEKLRGRGIPFNTDLMVNLPGQTPESFRRDLQYFLDLDVPLMIWPTMVLPNSAMSDPAYRREHALEVDERGLVLSSRSFTRADREGMMRLRSAYAMGELYSYLRYVMRFLQWDHGVPAAEFLDELQRALTGEPHRFPDFATHFVFPAMTLTSEEMIPESLAFRQASWTRLDEFYEALGAFVGDRFGILRDTALDAVLQANRAVIPDPAKSYPLSVPLGHDVAAWYGSRGARPLREHGPAVLTVTDPEGRSRAEAGQSTNQNSVREQTWELPSDLRRSAVPA